MTDRARRPATTVRFKRNGILVGIAAALLVTAGVIILITLRNGAERPKSIPYTPAPQTEEAVEEAVRREADRRGEPATTAAPEPAEQTPEERARKKLPPPSRAGAG